MVLTGTTKKTAKDSSSNFAFDSRNELPFIENQNILLIDARLLHQKLKVRSIFANWIKRRIEEFDFEENKDFFPNLEKSKGGRKAMEYHLTLDMAKELAMLERNEVGKSIRRYFIEAEKELRTKRLYAAQATITEISKTVKPIIINGRKMYEYRQVQSMLGFSTRSSISNVRQAGYAGLIVVFNGKAYCSEEYVRVMMSSAKTRALRAEAKQAKPVLPDNFGQLPLLHERGGKNALR